MLKCNIFKCFTSKMMSKIVVNKSKEMSYMKIQNTTGVPIMKESHRKTEDKRTYILVHGAWHGSWSWKKVENLMIDSGYRVIVPDLPSHGSNVDYAPKKEISLKTYVSYIKNIVEKSDTKSVLVGHSMAGIIISQVAEEVPDLISDLVYVAAFIPRDGYSLFDEARNFKSAGVSKEMKVMAEDNVIEINKSHEVKSKFFNCCEEKDADYALALLEPEPFKPFADKLTLTEGRFGKVKKPTWNAAKIWPLQ